MILEIVLLDLHHNNVDLSNVDKSLFHETYEEFCFRRSQHFYEYLMKCRWILCKFY